jgi:hypothetical protein
MEARDFSASDTHIFDLPANCIVDISNAPFPHLTNKPSLSADKISPGTP